jgi:N-acetylmuramoyl-L-alanine amidase
MQRRLGQKNSRSDSPVINLIKHNFSIVAFLAISMAGMFSVYQYFRPNPVVTNAAFPEGYTAEPTRVDQSESISPKREILGVQPANEGEELIAVPPKIGIVAGHRGFDSGTVCDDGLTEVQVTHSIAERTATLFNATGIEAETLDEFDPRIDGYSATALISIHIDSCDYINELASGFKISGSTYTDSSLLSICVQQAYGERTQLEYHPNSITPEMAGYHVFRKIGLGTPAIIIEVGFLNLDRQILTQGIDSVTRGLYDGIICYLDQSS